MNRAKPIPKNAHRLDYNPDTGILTWKDGRRKGLAAGNISGRGHLQLSLGKGDAYLAHRIAWYLYYGEDPGNMQVDHINGNPTDNRIVNLRLATDTQNRHNNHKAVGVYKYKNRWTSQFMKDGVTYRLGSFDCPLIARLAYEDKKRELCGEFSPF